MSDTPRSYEAVETFNFGEDVPVALGFARQLELELNEANEALTAALKREQEQRDRAVVAEDAMNKWRECAEKLGEVLDLCAPDLSGIEDLYNEAFAKLRKLQEEHKS